MGILLILYFVIIIADIVLNYYYIEAKKTMIKGTGAKSYFVEHCDIPNHTRQAILRVAYTITISWAYLGEIIPTIWLSLVLLTYYLIVFEVGLNILLTGNPLYVGETSKMDKLVRKYLDKGIMNKVLKGRVGLKYLIIKVLMCILFIYLLKSSI